MIQLYNYQEVIIHNIREKFKKGLKKIVMCSPTGSGKTVMFSYIVQAHIKKGGKVLVVTHRKELLKESGGAFESFGITPEEITAGSIPNLSANCHIAMGETLHRRAEKYADFIKSRTMIIFDEAHLQNFNKLFDFISPSTFVIGATATPHREGSQKPLSDFYEDIVQGIDTIDLIQKGYLATPKSYGVKLDLSKIPKIKGEFDPIALSQFYQENKIFDGVITNYERITPNQKAIAFTPSVESSKDLCLLFQMKGYQARHIDGSTPKKEREEIINWFKSTTTGILCNCGVLTAGFNCKDIQVVILSRATTSLPLFLQMVGRGSRTTTFKNSFTILDFGNNIFRHKHWEEPREWSIHKKKKKKEGVAPIKNCPNCEAILSSKVSNCPYCNFEFPKEEKVKEKKFVELVELPRNEINKIAKGKSLEEQAEMAKEKLISPFYILHNLTDYNEAVEFVRLMGYKQGFIHMNKKRFKVFQQ